MVGAISHNRLISGLYGMGMIRAVRPGVPVGRAGSAGTEPAGVGGAIHDGADTVEISPAARQAARGLDWPLAEGGRTDGGNSGASAVAEPDRVELSRGFRAELAPHEQGQVRLLRERDREIRAHEEAHRRAAGPHARGGPSYEYEVGPDGNRYAVDGKVQIDTSAIPDDPQATIRKMQQVRQAALAPAEPSAQDRAVAAQTMATEQQARAELIRHRTDETREATGGQAAEAPGVDAGGFSVAAFEHVQASIVADAAEQLGTTAGDRSVRTGRPGEMAARFAAFASTGLLLDATA